MPKAKMYDKWSKSERTVYRRPVIENYGPSYVWLQELPRYNVYSESQDYSYTNIEGKSVWLPVLDLAKYYQDAKCYALIEKFSNNSIVMIDILYSDEDLIRKFENDDKELDEFLERFTREKINSINLSSPALVVAPTNKDDAQKFVQAMEYAMQEALGNLILLFQNEKQGKVDKKHESLEKKRENMVLLAIKTLYDSFLGLPVDEKIDESEKGILSKKSMMIKTGATLINGEEVGKYYSNYYSKFQIGKEITAVRESIGLYIRGIDDALFVSDRDGIEEQRITFGNALLESNILETFSYLNPNKTEMLMFAGKYNEALERIEVDKRTEIKLDNINKLIMGRSNDGR